MLALQEQSQAPALGGKDSLESWLALEGLVRLALKRKAQVMLLMTWGYLDGDKKEHRAIFPDYHAMQVTPPLPSDQPAGLIHAHHWMQLSLSLNPTYADAGWPCGDPYWACSRRRSIINVTALQLDCIREAALILCVTRGCRSACQMVTWGWPPRSGRA